MKLETYDTPHTREEFELRFHYLSVQMKHGKCHFNGNITMDGLKNMRKLPNGRIDFLSVNEMARLMANQIYHMRNMTINLGC